MNQTVFRFIHGQAGAYEPTKFAFYQPQFLYEKKKNKNKQNQISNGGGKQIYLKFEFHSCHRSARVHLGQLLDVYGQIAYQHFGLATSDGFQESVVYEYVLFFGLRKRVNSRAYCDEMKTKNNNSKYYIYHERATVALKNVSHVDEYSFNRKKRQNSILSF